MSSSKESITPPPEKESAKKSITLTVLNEIDYLLALTFYGIAGSMARQGLSSLLNFEGLHNLWPNFTGCVLISASNFLLGKDHANLFNTGFCGSLTTFSQLITVDVFTVAVTPQKNWPNHGYGVPEFMSRLILHLCVCFSGYTIGQHIGRCYEYIGIPRPHEPSERLFMRFASFLGVAAWVVCLVTSITTKTENRTWALAGVFSPFGVWLRYYLAKLNKPDQVIKVGTFSANMFGTFLSCIFTVCGKLDTTNEIQGQILAGLSNGFTACLTTVSTFVKECQTMKTYHGYFYAAVSLFLGYSMAFIIIGSYLWTR